MGKAKPQTAIIPVERVVRNIYLLRGQKVMLDYDLADLYDVPTKVLNQAVSRNKARFPDDFMFPLSKEETEELNRSQFVTGSQKHRDSRFPPRAFTQEGIAMLSGVLRSPKAVAVNIAIMRTFVRLREMIASNDELARRIDKHDHDIAILYDYVKKLLGPPPVKKNPIGYIWPKD